jgi:hypothetical protein
VPKVALAAQCTERDPDPATKAEAGKQALLEARKLADRAKAVKQKIESAAGADARSNSTAILARDAAIEATNAIEKLSVAVDAWAQVAAVQGKTVGPTLDPTKPYDTCAVVYPDPLTADTYTTVNIALFPPVDPTIDSNLQAFVAMAVSTLDFH